MQEHDSPKEKDLYLQFNLVLSDVSAFLVDGDYWWGAPLVTDQNKHNILPVIDKCAIVIKLQQVSICFFCIFFLSFELDFGVCKYIPWSNVDFIVPYRLSLKILSTHQLDLL